MEKKKPSTNISNAKNVISDANIEAGGNIHIGDNINVTRQDSSGPTEPFSSSIADQLRKMVAKDRIRPAIDQLLIYSKELDEDLFNQVIQQSQRWNKLKKENGMGLLTNDQANLIHNQIVNGLLGIISEMAKLPS